MDDLDVRPDLDREPWADFVRHLDVGRIERVGLLPEGIARGRPTIAIAVRLKDGRMVVAETSWTAWRSAMIQLYASPVAEFDLIDHPETTT